MTKEEFDSLKVGDIVTNKEFDKLLNREIGYDYEVIEKDNVKINIKEISMGFEYILLRSEIETCLYLRKKE